MEPFCLIRAPLWQRTGRGITEEFLNNYAVTPYPIDFAVTTIHPNHPEAYALMQCQTCRVLREDAGHEFPEPQVCIEAAEVYEGQTSCPRAARPALDIHGVLRNARIAGPAPVQTRTGPGHHLAITFHDHGRIAFSFLGELGDDLLDRTGFCLKSGVALLDALVIDRGNGWGILQSCQPHWSVGGITHPLLSFSLKLLQCFLQTLYGLVDFLSGDGERRHEADGIGSDCIE